MRSGKCAMFSRLIASISIKKKPCDLFLNQRAMFLLIFQPDLEGCCISGFAHVYSCVDRTREKNIVLVVSPLINLMKDQVSRLNSLGISAISLSDVSSELENRAVENENKPRKLKSSSVYRWRSLRTNFNSKIIAGSSGVVRVRECHIPSVNFIGQRHNKSFDVTEINLWLEFADVIFGRTSDSRKYVCVRRLLHNDHLSIKRYGIVCCVATSP